MEAKDVFLEKIIARIDNGEFDDQFTLPFMNKKLMTAVVRGKINKRADKGVAPMLSEADLKMVIEEMREGAGSAFYLFVAYGILEEVEDGYQLSKKGKIALRESSRL